MRISPLFPTCCIFLFSTSSLSAADSIPVKPGMWETTMTMTSPMFPQPRVETTTECVDKSEFSINELMPADESECTVVESNVDGNTLTWKMQCQMQGGSGEGSGTFVSNGDNGTGEMYMKMTVQGQSFEMQNSWQGKHIGPC